VLIKKYGTDGTHAEAQKSALERLSKRKEYTPVPEPVKPVKKKKEEEPKAEAAGDEAPAAEAKEAEAPKDAPKADATTEETAAE